MRKIKALNLFAEQLLSIRAVILSTLFLISLPSWGAPNAQTFTYQGRFMNASGTAPLTGMIDITFSIYDPSVSCLLYQETQTNIDLTATAGIFAAQLGSAVGASKRTLGDSGLTMAQIFANNSQILAPGAAHCTAGYTPAAGDSRVLRVTVLPHSTGVPTTISPDQTINSVPQAQTAETLQGLSPGSFIQSGAGVAGQNNVSLSTLEALTGGADASALHNHDSLYVKIGTSGSSANLGTTAYTTGGSLGIGTSTLSGNLSFSGTSGAQTITVNRDTTAGGAGSALSVAAGGATSGATNQNGGNLVLSGGVSTGSGSSNIQFQTTSGGSSGSADNSPSTRMILNSSGELGIGVATPGAQLEVDTSSAAILGEILKGSSAQSGDLLQFQNSSGSVLSKFDSAGYLTLPGSPSSALQAATKQYVDSSIAGATAGVATFNTRNGAVTLQSSDVTAALGYTPVKNSTDTMTGSLTIDQILGVGASAGSNTQLQSTSTSATNITEVLKEAPSQTADLLDFENSSGTVLSKFDSTGALTLNANPTSSLQAATKAYVDTAVSGVVANGYLPTSGGTMTGVLKAAAGTDAAPAISSAADATTGINFLGGNVSVSSGGTKSLQISSSAIGAFTQLQEANGSSSTPEYSFSGDTGIGMFHAATNQIGFSTSGVEEMRIDANGNVGIGTSTPGSGTKLRVNGQAATSSSSTAGATIDWSLGNASTTSYDCGGGNLSFVNIRDGGAYTLVNTSTTTAQCSFSTTTTGDDAASVTYRFLPANTSRIASSHTIYSLQRIGTIVYVSWQTGF